MAKYPWIRDTLIEELNALASLDFQRQVWINRNFPPNVQHGDYEGLDMTVQFLFDEFGLQELNENDLGAVLENRDEVQALKVLCEKFNIVFDNYDVVTGDFRLLINTAEWKDVVEAAHSALLTLKNTP